MSATLHYFKLYQQIRAERDPNYLENYRQMQRDSQKKFREANREKLAMKARLIYQSKKEMKCTS